MTNQPEQINLYVNMNPENQVKIFGYDPDEDDTTESARADGQRAGEAAGFQRGYAAGKAAGAQISRAEGAAAERERIRAIMALDIARERPREAAHIALSTSIETKDAHEAIRGMAIGAQTAADASWNSINDDLRREMSRFRRSGSPR